MEKDDRSENRRAILYKDDLPEKLTLYPGEKVGPYTIAVTNNGKITYNAILYYDVTAGQGVKYEIKPASGASQEVKPEETVRFEIYITILKDSAPGRLTIEWRIERE